ncbi:MAG: hypothetical protein ABJC79_03755 [Acidimicrobiia bacterium]
MRKVLCSLGAGAHRELLDLSGETFSIFADRHGYDLDLRHELLTPDRAPAWNKIVLLRDLVARYDLVLWIDADAAIVDPTVDIADSLGRRDLMGLVAHEYDGMRVPNTGVWLLRRNRSVQKFLARVWDRTEYLDHDWWENAAVIRELGFTVEPRVEPVTEPRIVRRTCFLERTWNSIEIDTSPHSRINHYPGRSQEHRVEALARDLETARAIAATLDPVR